MDDDMEMTTESQSMGGEKGSPTREGLADELEIVAAAMQQTGERVAYLGGFGEMGKHGRKMMDDARKSLVWANRLRATQRTGEG